MATKAHLTNIKAKPSIVYEDVLRIGLLLELLDGMKYPRTSYVVTASSIGVVCCRRLVLSRAIGVVRRRRLVLSRAICVYIGVVHLEDLVPCRTSSGTSSEVLCTSGCLRWTSSCTLGARHCAPQRSQLFAYGTHQMSRPFANGKNRGVFSLGLKPFVNGSCTQTGGNKGA